MHSSIARCIAAGLTLLLLAETCQARPCKHPPPNKGHPKPRSHGPPPPLGVTLTYFGDSLSDNGSNEFPRSHNLIPDPKTAYYKGRVSNGPVWSEYMQGLSQGKVSHVYNYAYIDAYACKELEHFEPVYTAATAPPSLSEQMDMYLAQRSTLKKGTKNIAIVWIGNNDFSRVLVAANQTAAGTMLVTCILNNLAKLAQSGETDVVLFNLAPLDITPYGYLLSAPLRALVKFAIAQLNGGLMQGVQALKAQLPQTQFYYYDANTFISQSIASGAFGPITNTSCVVATPVGKNPIYTAVDPNVTTTTCPSKGVGYAFWDWVHPTTITHALTAAGATQAFKKWGLY